VPTEWLDDLAQAQQAAQAARKLVLVEVWRPG
jgi:hypothetical protein